MSIYNIKYVGKYIKGKIKIVGVSKTGNAKQDECIITLLEEFAGYKDVIRIEHWLVDVMYILLNEDLKICTYENKTTKDTRYADIKDQLMALKSQAEIQESTDKLYKVKFYGVFYSYKMEFSDTAIYAKKELRHAVPGFENFFFEISVLKEYEGKNDVLKLEFEDGDVCYETLNYPYMFLTKQKTWMKSADRSTPEAFMKAYLNLN